MSSTAVQDRWVSSFLGVPVGDAGALAGETAPPEAAPGGGSEAADKPGGGGGSDIVGTIIGLFTNAIGDVTLKYEAARAIPTNTVPEDYSWSGPQSRTFHYGPQKSILFRTVLGEAEVQVRWFYSGQYINDFGARLLSAEVDKVTSSLAIDLKVDHIDPKPSGGIARIDFILTFAFSNLTGGKELKTVTGVARGDGSGEFSV